MSDSVELKKNSFLSLWQSYCDKKMECECLNEENQRLTDIATKHATRCDELYEALELMLNKFCGHYVNEAERVAVIRAREVLDKSRTEADK